MSKLYFSILFTNELFQQQSIIQYAHITLVALLIWDC